MALDLLGAKLSQVAVILVVVFTVVELGTMVVWLELRLREHYIPAVLVLAAGLAVEHFVSAATGVWVAKAVLSKSEEDREV